MLETKVYERRDKKAAPVSVVPVSVLLSLYSREKPEYLREALSSIMEQTAMPAEVVMVLDGPVGDDLRGVLDEFSRAGGATPDFRIVRLEKNVGLGRALSEGLRHCGNELVARMDTDDVMMPHRMAEQYRYMASHPDIAVCGAWIDEFVAQADGSRHVVSTRRLPVEHDDIFNFGKGRSPMNHPVVMFRKSRVEAAGGYEHFPLFEDYYLWVRMLCRGEKFHNLPESLLWFRLSDDVYKRRGGLRYAMDEVSLQRAIYRLGYISRVTMMKNVAIRFLVRLMPNSFRALIYKWLLR